ncbi:unnamed protein product [Prunus brigantina]
MVGLVDAQFCLSIGIWRRHCTTILMLALDLQFWLISSRIRTRHPGESFEFVAPGAFWMIRIRLRVYFPELRFPDRSAAQWQVVIGRTYPWFRPGYELFEKEPKRKQPEAISGRGSRVLLCHGTCPMEVGSLLIIISGGRSVSPQLLAQGNLDVLGSFHSNPIGVVIGAALGGM